MLYGRVDAVRGVGRNIHLAPTNVPIEPIYYFFNIVQHLKHPSILCDIQINQSNTKEK